MCEDFAAETELADCFAVFIALFRGGRACELDVVNAKGVECPCDFDFGFGVKKTVCELLAFSQCRFNNLESRNCRQSYGVISGRLSQGH